MMKINELIEKYHLGSITDDEIVFLLKYLKDKEPNHEILAYYQEIWDHSGEYNESIDSKNIYDKVVTRAGFSTVSLKSVTESPGRVGFRGYLWTFMRYAAVFVMSFGLFWLTKSVLINKTTAVKPSSLGDQITRVEVPFGSKSRVILPDGSVVNLNSGSTLIYSSTGFDSLKRSVFLTGEGFFNVAKDAKRPFYVTTSGIKLKVLGTIFNLKSYPDENTEEATLVTGSVEIYASVDKVDKGNPIVLKPNQTAVFVKSEKIIHTTDPSKLLVTKINPVELKSVNYQPASTTEQIISWKENRLVFDNQKFSDLIVQIERWYDVKITVGYQELLSARFTGKFDKETIEQVLQALETITPFNFKIKQNLITISKN